MRIVIGVIGVLAACVFIGQSAVTLGQTAFNMASNDEVWRQALMAAGASSVVIYEGIGLVFAGLLWHVGKRWLAFGCCLLVLAAAVYTVRLELAYNVTGQADRIAERQASTERRTEAKSDLTRLRAERDKIGVLRPPEAIKAELESYREHRRWGSTSGCTDATVPDSISYCAQYHKMQAQYASAVRLKEIGAEIERIEGERNWVPVNAGGAPDAAWAARNFGGGEQGWADAFMVFGILFWVLARTLALPIAAGAMTGVRVGRNEGGGEASSQPDEGREATSVSRLEPAPRDPSGDVYERISGVAANEGAVKAKSAEILGFPAVENAAANAGDEGTGEADPDDDNDDYPKGKVSEWFDECTRNAGAACIKASRMHGNYTEWCHSNDRIPVNASVFGVKAREYGVKPERRRDGMHYRGFALRCEGGSEKEAA